MQASQKSVPDNNLDTSTGMQKRKKKKKRNHTAKGLEIHKQEAKKHEKAFNKAYDFCKQIAKKVRLAEELGLDGERLKINLS